MQDLLAEFLETFDLEPLLDLADVHILHIDRLSPRLRPVWHDAWQLVHHPSRPQHLVECKRLHQLGCAPQGQHGIDEIAERHTPAVALRIADPRAGEVVVCPNLGVAQHRAV